MYRLRLKEPTKPIRKGKLLAQGPGGLARSLEATQDYAVKNVDVGFLLKSLPVGVVVINTNGTVEYSNPKAQAIFQHPLNSHVWSEVVASVVRPQPDDGCEVTLKNGLKVRVDTQPLPDLCGQMLVVSDLTETRKMQSLAAHHKRLSDLGKMVAALAHQIRTPITTATLYAHHIIKTAPQDANFRPYVEKLITQLGNVEKQVKDMLTYAQFEQPLNDEVDMDVLPQLIVEPLEDYARSKHITLRIAASQARNTRIRGNLSLLVSVLSNLVINAIEASAMSSSVVVGVFSDKETASFFVSDSGKGISFENQQKVFEPFFTTKPTGTGLGLAVAKRVVDQHGGTMKIDSDLGVGTTMIATFTRTMTKERGEHEEAACIAS